MVKNEKYDLKGELNAINNTEGHEKMKSRLRSVTKKRRLNGRVKFVLNMLSHYKFRQHLINKGNEYGCQIIEVTEEYTSKTCTNCLQISDKYTNRVKECTNCRYKIDRDINGARNILLMNMSGIKK
jgi:transposase